MHSATNSSMKCLFLLSVLLLAVLSGCGTPAPIAQTPATNSAPTAIPPLATSAPLQATMQPTRGQTTAPSVTPIPAPLPPTGLDTSPTVIPASETPPLVVDRLPLDEPWVWIPTRACNYDSGIVIAVSRTGRVQQLQTPIVTVVERTALPPVLVTCTIDGTFALIETDYWTSRPLAIPASTRLQSFLVSPDGIHLAFNAAPDPGSIANQKYDKQLIQIVNMQTGALRTVIDTATLHRTAPDAGSYDLIEPIGWRDQVLYTHMQTSASSVFWRVDLAPAQPIIHQELQIGETGLWAASPTGNALVWADSYDHPPPRLRDLVRGDEYAVDGAQDAVFSPDGTMLASIRAATDGQCCDVVLTDLAHGAPTTRGPRHPVGAPAAIQGRSGLQWSHDGRYILVPTRVQLDNPIQALVLTQDASVIGNVTLPYTVIDDLRLLHGDQLVLIVREGERSILRVITLHANNTPGIPATVLPKSGADSVMYTFVHTP